VRRWTPFFPEYGAQVGAEALVLLSYRVRANGRTTDVEIVERIGHPEFGWAARNAVRLWEFEPVRVAGEPRDSEPQRIVIPFHQYAGSDPSKLPEFVRRDFPSDRVIVFRALRDGDLARADAAMEPIRETDWLSLSEWVTRDLLEAMIAAQSGDWDRAGSELNEAMVYDGRHLPDALLPTARRLRAAIDAAPEGEEATYVAGPEASRVLREEIGRLAASEPE
jgi:TonB family protein